MKKLKRGAYWAPTFKVTKELMDECKAKGMTAKEFNALVDAEMDQPPCPIQSDFDERSERAQANPDRRDHLDFGVYSWKEFLAKEINPVALEFIPSFEDLPMVENRMVEESRGFHTIKPTKKSQREIYDRAVKCFCKMFYDEAHFPVYTEKIWQLGLELVAIAPHCRKSEWCSFIIGSINPETYSKRFIFVNVKKREGDETPYIFEYRVDLQYCQLEENQFIPVLFASGDILRSGPVNCSRDLLFTNINEFFTESEPSGCLNRSSNYQSAVNSSVIEMCKRDLLKKSS